MSHILVNVAWPYANGPRHIGHVAGFGVPSDVYARYERMKGNDVLMVSGTDEHGTPILVEADKEGVSAQELANRYNRVIAKDLCDLGLSYDLFTRTTTGNHEKVVQELFKQCLENGYIYKGTQKVAISPSTGRTLPDRYIEGTCPICGADGARGDQCDACGNELDPDELLNPVSKINGETPRFEETEHFFPTCRRSPKPISRGSRPAKAGAPTSSTSPSACSRKSSRAPSRVTSTGAFRCRSRAGSTTRTRSCTCGSTP